MRPAGVPGTNLSSSSPDMRLSPVRCLSIGQRYNSTRRAAVKTNDRAGSHPLEWVARWLLPAGESIPPPLRLELESQIEFSHQARVGAGILTPRAVNGTVDIAAVPAGAEERQHTTQTGVVVIKGLVCAPDE
jgi:hypothetical protein